MDRRKRRRVANTSGQRLNLLVSPEAATLLHVHSLYLAETPGDLVDKLIKQHLREFQVRHMKKTPVSLTDTDPVDTEGRQKPGEDVSVDDAKAA
jgi:hypothetical protein